MVEYICSHVSVKSRKAHKSQHGVAPRAVKFSDPSTDGKVCGSVDLHTSSLVLSHDELFARLNALEKEEQENERAEVERGISELMNDVEGDETDRNVENDRMRHVTFDDEWTACRSFKRRAYSLDSDDEEAVSQQLSGNSKSSRSYPGSPGGSRKPSDGNV